MYHPSKGPEISRLMEIKLGKLTKSSLAFFNPGRSDTAGADPDVNSGGEVVLFVSRLKFKASIFLRTAAFPRRKSGVADCESFHGGQDRKSGPWKGMIQLERGERKVREI